MVFIFQHDDDPKHTANAVKSYLRKTADKTLTVMEWPPQSPDLNIIEAVWDHLDRERNKRQPKSKEELWEVLIEAWYKYPRRLRKKTSGLPKRFLDVLSATSRSVAHFILTLPVEAHFVLNIFVYIFTLFSVCILTKRY